MKKITALIIAAVLIFATSFTVSAETTDYSEFNSVIAEGLESRASSIDVAKFNLNVEEFKAAYMAAIFNVPEYFWVDDSYQMAISGETKMVKNVTPLYNDLYSEGNVALFESEIEKALSILDDSLNDYEKVVLLHDYLVNTSFYVISDDEPVYSAYSVLVDHIGLCRGYARAIKVLLDRIGINSIIVRSDKMSHAWNMVELDGEWYQLDVTWDDPTGGVERVTHDFILISDTTLGDSHHSHYDWESDYTADSTKYEDGFWLSAESQIHYYNNNFYFIKDSKIISRNRETGEETAIYNFSDRWYLWQDTGYYYFGTFSGLSLIDGRLYFNTPDGVYSISTTGEGLQKVYTLSDEEAAAGRIYATSYRGGKFYYTLTTDPSSGENTIKTLDLNTQLLGDVNLDGKVNVLDAVIVSRISAGIYQPTDVQRVCADVNSDDRVSVVDSVILARYSAGLISGFTAA